MAFSTNEITCARLGVEEGKCKSFLKRVTANEKIRQSMDQLLFLLHLYSKYKCSLDCQIQFCQPTVCLITLASRGKQDPTNFASI